jgi:hypothetical protein
MNERIKQLWDDSIEEFSKQHQYATIMLPEPLREKFAELIVRECALLCVSRPGPGDDIRSREHCSEQILQHFGVEE